MRRLAEAIPTSLVVFRFVVGPVILALAWAFGLPWRSACAVLLALGVLSDILDGIIARRLGVSTPGLRKLDSKADVAFWICVFAAALVLRPIVIPVLAPMAAALVALEFVAPIVSLVRFRQEASTHHYLSKAFGLGLWLLMSVLFLHGPLLWLEIAVFALGVASQAEAIAIMLTIPAWRADVRGLGHALALRAEARAGDRA